MQQGSASGEGPEPEQARIGRLIVYGLIEQECFAFADVLELLQDLGFG